MLALLGLLTGLSSYWDRMPPPKTARGPGRIDLDPLEDEEFSPLPLTGPQNDLLEGLAPVTAEDELRWMRSTPKRFEYGHYVNK